MELRDIAGVIVNGQAVYYRPGEVIAVGEAARDFVIGRGGTVAEPDPPEDDEAADADGDVYAPAPEEGDPVPPIISPRPSSFRLRGLANPLAVVDEARSRGLRVQPNHVFFTHCGCGCDPCCGANPYGAFPYRANRYSATPYRANHFQADPYRANAVQQTNAIPTAHDQIADRGPDDAQQGTINVWVIDTGLAHADFTTALDPLIQAGHIVGDKMDRPDQVPSPLDGLIDPVAGHGTFIAGIIEQLAPGCDIRVKGVINPGGDLDEQDVADAIDALVATTPNVELPRTILNLSFGGGLYESCNSVVGDAIASAQEGGVVVIASAGNDKSCTPVYPAHFPGVVAVGAVDSDGEPAHFTNIGSWVQACALGVEVVSTFFEFSNSADPATLPDDIEAKDFDGWAIWSGTSFATPVVVAAIARKMSNGTSAYEALEDVLAEGTPIPCLGVRVGSQDFSDVLVPN